MKKKIWKYIICAAASVIFIGGTATGIALATHKHKFADSWVFDNSHHWHTATCSHDDEITEKQEHAFGDGVVVNATCVQGGFTRYKCTDCGFEKNTDETEKLTTHTYIKVSEVSETCTTTGVKNYSCVFCGDTKTETIEATGHDLGFNNYNYDGETLAYTQNCRNCTHKTSVSEVEEFTVVSVNEIETTEYQQGQIYVLTNDNEDPSRDDFSGKTLTINQPNVTIIGTDVYGLTVNVAEGGTGAIITGFVFIDASILLNADTHICNSKMSNFFIDIGASIKVHYEGNSTDSCVITASETVNVDIVMINNFMADSHNSVFSAHGINFNSFELKGNVFYNTYDRGVIDIYAGNLVHEYEDNGEFTTDTSLLTDKAKAFAKEVLENNTIYHNFSDCEIFQIGNVKFSEIDWE